MDKKIYIKDIIEDKSQMISLADMAKQDSHNFVNFENRIDNYLSYHTATYDGSVVAIGNAPTALFHLLELLDEGMPKPALILGFPVGFVGAAESKAELASNTRGVPFITLHGRRGGSAIAAAAVNALAKKSEV